MVPKKHSKEVNRLRIYALLLSFTLAASALLSPASRFKLVAHAAEEKEGKGGASDDAEKAAASDDPLSSFKSGSVTLTAEISLGGETAWFYLTSRKVHFDLTLDLDKKKAVLSMQQLEAPELSRVLSGAPPTVEDILKNHDDVFLNNAEPEYTTADDYPQIEEIMNNTSGSITYDLIVGDDGGKTHNSSRPIIFSCVNASNPKAIIWSAKDENWSAWPSDGVVDVTMYYPYELYVCGYSTDYSGSKTDTEGNPEYLVEVVTQEMYKGMPGNGGGMNMRIGEAPAPVPEPEEKEYTMKVDSYGFANSADAFFSSDALRSAVSGGVYSAPIVRQLMKDTDYSHLINGLSFSEIAWINRTLGEQWRGFCEGMAITNGLFFEERLSFGSYGGGKCAYDLETPVKNERLLRAILYYHLLGNVREIFEGLQGGGGTGDSNQACLSLVEQLKAHPEIPLVVGFDMYKTNSDIKDGHSMLAFKVEDHQGAYKYDVSVYDPNLPEKARHLYIRSDGASRMVYQSYSRINVAAAVPASHYYDSSITFPSLTKTQKIIQTKGDVEITVEGKKAQIIGQTVTGDLKVTVSQENEGREKGAKTIIIHGIDPAAEVVIKRLDAAEVCVKTDDGLICAAGAPGEMSISPDGRVEENSENGEAEVYVGMVSDANGGDLPGTMVEAAGRIVIVPHKGGASVQTEDDEADITASGQDGSITFKDADARGGLDIDSDDGRASLTTPDGYVVGEGDAKEDGNTEQTLPPEAAQEPGENEGDTHLDYDFPVPDPDPDPIPSPGRTWRDDDTTVPTVKDNDKTGYTPENWSWKAKGEGYKKKYFTSGKYVRKGGSAVIYLDSADSDDGFSYQLFALADGAKTNDLYLPSEDSEESYTWAVKESSSEAFDEGYAVYFTCDGKGKLVLESKWDAEDYYQYAAPDGDYYLVREKK